MLLQALDVKIQRTIPVPRTERQAFTGLRLVPGPLELQLYRAAEAGDLRRATGLLTAEARPTVKEDGGWDSLMHAASGGHFVVVRMSLAHGVDPNAREDKYGFRPLWAQSEPTSGAGVEVSGKTALIIVVSQVVVSQDHADVVRALLNAGADPDVRDVRGMAARDWAEMPLVAAPGRELPGARTPSNLR